MPVTLVRLPNSALTSEATFAPTAGDNVLYHGLNAAWVEQAQAACTLDGVALGASVTDWVFVSWLPDFTGLTLNFSQSGTDQVQLRFNLPTWSAR